jgi:hypothetical protein
MKSSLHQTSIEGSAAFINAMIDEGGAVSNPHSAIRIPQLGKLVTGSANPASCILVGRIEASFSPVSDAALLDISQTLEMKNRCN